MTHDELIEAVAEELAEELGIRPWSEIAEDRGHLRSLVRAGANYDVNEPTKMDLRDMARAAIREIAPAVLDEAAGWADNFADMNAGSGQTDIHAACLTARDISSAIRALKTRYE